MSDAPRNTSATPAPGGSTSGTPGTPGTPASAAEPTGPKARPAAGGSAVDRPLGTLTDPGAPLPVKRRGRRTASETYTITFPRPRTVAARLANRLAAALAPPSPAGTAAPSAGGSTEIGPSRSGERRVRAAAAPGAGTRAAGPSRTAAVASAGTVAAAGTAAVAAAPAAAPVPAAGPTTPVPAAGLSAATVPAAGLPTATVPAAGPVAATGIAAEVGPAVEIGPGVEYGPAGAGPAAGAGIAAGAVAAGRAGRATVAGWVRSLADLPRAAATILTVLVVLALTLTGSSPPGSDPTAGQSLQDSGALDPQSQSDSLGTPLDETPLDLSPNSDGAGVFPPVPPSTTPTGAPLAVAVTQTQTYAPPRTLAAPSTKITVLPEAAPPARLPATPAPGQTSAAAKLAASGIPARAKTAYVNAANRMATVNPSCKLSWSLVAAIARIESDHGRTGGKTSLAAGSGRATPPIYGVRLDGSKAGTAVIRDSDSGTLDTDAQFDRAVGPMQFLPSTWRSFAMDGDNDGAADPQDIDDAALTAGRYLCTGITAGSTVNLSSNTGQWNAAYRYNHSKNYANLALAMSLTYAGGKPVDVVNPPSGATTAPAIVTITVTPPAPAATTTTTATTPVATTTSTPVTTTTTTTTDPPTTSTVTTTVGDPAPPPVITVTVSVTTTTVTETSTSTSTTIPTETSTSTSSSTPSSSSTSGSTTSSSSTTTAAGAQP